MNVRYAGAVAVLLLTGCAAASSPETAVDTPVATTTVTVTATETVRPTPSNSPNERPSSASPAAAKTCDDYSSADLGDSSAEEDSIAAAVTEALPAEVQLKPGVQVIESLEPAKIEAVVRICQDTPMEESQLIEVASAIAVSIKADPVSKNLVVLVVSTWHPNGEYLEQGETVTTEYNLYTWDDSAAVPLSSNWE